MDKDKVTTKSQNENTPKKTKYQRINFGHSIFDKEQNDELYKMENNKLEKKRLFDIKTNHKNKTIHSLFLFIIHIIIIVHFEKKLNI